MAKNCLIKLGHIIGWLIITLAFGMLLGFVIMFTMLARYKECNDLNFEPKYCERYKDF